MVSAIRPVTIDTNDLVWRLWPGVRKRFKDLMPYLDGYVGDHWADQAIRHVVHRVTIERSRGSYHGQMYGSDTVFLRNQIVHTGINLGPERSETHELLLLAQDIAHDAVRDYERNEGVEITGQTP